jgi:hypothetical protein
LAIYIKKIMVYWDKNYHWMQVLLVQKCLRRFNDKQRFDEKHIL